MDLLKPLEKSFVCFDKHNIFNDPNTGQLKHQKINNVQWSATNEQLRMSGNSEHYATIQDRSGENTLFTPNPEYDNATPGKRESASDLYVSFNTGDRLPTSPNKERTAGYSYATNGEIHFLRDSNNENHQREQIQQLEHNEKNSKHDAYISKYQSKGTDESTDTYLEPNPRRIGESGDDTNHSDIRISWLSETHEYHEPDNGLGATLTSTYDVGRVPSNKIVTAPNKKEKKICSKCKIITGVILVILVAAATASIVAVLMIGDLKEDDNMCDYKHGCQTKCQKYPNLSNGHTNITEEVLPQVAVKITCNKGFEVKEIDTAICLETGSWSEVITCEPVDCGIYKPPNHVHTQHSVHETTLGSSINLQCEPGFHFTTSSGSSVMCNENGVWVGNPKCENLVDLSVDTDNVLIGGMATLSCEFRKIPNWRNIKFKRINRKSESVTIASVVNNVDSYKVTTDSDRIIIIDKTFTHESGTFKVMIETVKCSDAFEEPGEINITCDIETSDTVNTFRDEKIVRIQGKPVKPELFVPAQVVEDDIKSTLFHCEMLFPEPNGHVRIDTGNDGSFTTLLSSPNIGEGPYVWSSSNGVSNTNAAWIDTIRFDLDNCWYRMKVTFGLKNVSMEWHRKHIRCTAKPSEEAYDQTVFTSESGVVKVIQDTLCNGKSQVRYPYDCEHFIVCDDKNHFNSVLEVRACDNNACYDDQSQTCIPCSPSRGCPITDIFFSDRHSATIGGQIDIVCIVEDLKGLTDIKITRANGEFVSSIKSGDNIRIPNFNIKSDQTYVNETHGKFTIHVDFLLCTDKGTYRCSPEGTGDVQSEDVIDLDLNC
ncbi:uncharacterized protein LOC132748433 [Ruditapes philippinarum]|uniref:uncharacterized protein LOC132748433 n=1 Tax=Ruditapes philippinarum TaxID=129788 RepID=UPI00295C0671|nr:uncharacterized protein LOC132748433 [Ruditapes philippinarum]